MKFRIKITLFCFMVMVLTLGIGGFLMIYSTFLAELNLNMESASKNNQFLSTIYYSITDQATFDSPLGNQKYLLKELQTVSNQGQIYIGKKDEILYFDDHLFGESLRDGEQGMQILKKEKLYLQVMTKMKVGREHIYCENLVDISDIYRLRDKNYLRYCIFLVIVSLLGTVVIWLFSVYVTRPFRVLEATAKEITLGNLGKRNPTSYSVMKAPEFVSLAAYFNQMADRLENYIVELKEQNQRQDDFISRFTHELKTPLTSIIGYADLLRSYEMKQEEQYEMANYVYKEGKRLEDLSRNLLQLILLKQDTFTFQKVDSQKFFLQVKDTLRVVVEKYMIELVLEIDEGILLIEPVLMKSLLYNLIDNACKASLPDSQVILRGKIGRERYEIAVEDFGKGIPKESIDKVTVPFYMVDKSRARKQGGAGIGLSLCKEIATIHKSELKIVSVPGKGTVISFAVDLVKE